MTQPFLDKSVIDRFSHRSGARAPLVIQIIRGVDKLQNPARLSARTRSKPETRHLASHHHYLGIREGRFPQLDRIFDRCQGHHQITDALLIEIALGNDAVLATFDARFRHLSPRPEAVEVIPLL